MILFHTVNSQAENDFSDICYKLLSLFFCIISPVLYTVVNYPNTWFTRSFLARRVHQSNKINNKIQNVWFPLPAYSVLQLPKQCLRKMWCCLTFVCVYNFIYMFQCNNVVHDDNSETSETYICRPAITDMNSKTYDVVRCRFPYSNDANMVVLSNVTLRHVLGILEILSYMYV